MTFISYAQNYEDVTLFRALKRVEKGFYVDVGAQDPIADSVTKAFYERGWRGINIEPIEYWFHRLLADRPEDHNLQVAAAAEAATLKLFEVVGTGMSTYNAHVAAQHAADGYEVREREVPTRRLDNICDELGVTEIHFLKIDVEGAEGSVLAGIDLNRLRPWVILLESIEPNSPISTHGQWEGLLTSRGYAFVHFDGLNRYYVARERENELKDALSSPPNYFDHFIRYSEWSASQNAARVTAELSQTRERLQGMENELSQTRERLQAKEHELIQAHTQNNALRENLSTSELSQTRERLQGMENELSQTRERLQAKEHELIQAHTQNNALRENLSTSQQHAARLEGVLTQTCERLREHETALAVVYHSRSWRMTAPLRKANRLFKQLTPMIGDRISTITSLPRRVARRVLLSALVHVLFRPERKAKLARLMARFPTLDARLRAFSRDNRMHAIVFSSNKHSFPGAPATAPLSGESFPTGRNFRSEFSSPPLFPLKAGRRVIYYYVDHTILCSVNTGMQRVTRRLGRALLEQGEQIYFVKWDAHHHQFALLNQKEVTYLSQWNGPVSSPAVLENYPLPGAQPVFVRQRAPEEGHWLLVPEVTHITYHPQPVTLDIIMAAKRLGLKTAFIFYDAIPLRRHEFASMAPLHAEYMQHLLLADLVVPISRWSAADLVSFFVHHEKSALTAIPVVEPLLLPGDPRLTEGRVKSPVATQKIILSVGTIERRKNQGVLLEAFEAFCSRYPDADWKLVLVGNLHQNTVAEVNAAVLQNKNIVWRGNISDEDLDELYRACTFTVFPSQEEGFGLPIVESLGYGKPCVCANFGAMAEVAEGGGCLTVDVRDVQALAKAIEALATNNSEPLNRLVGEIAQREAVTWADYTDAFRARLDSASGWRSSLGSVYYCVHSTCKTPFNSGIQRVVRALACALIQAGVRLTPVKWDSNLNSFIGVTRAELEYLSRWNGPSADQWNYEFDVEQVSPRDWLLSAELLLDSGDLDSITLERWAQAKGLRTAWIFYDAIPWKLRDFYVNSFVTAHTLYMRGLETATLIFPISEYSARELLRFIDAEGIRMPDRFDRIIARALPGEYLGSDRVDQIPERSTGIVRMLCVSTVESRKNHLGLLRAFEAVQLKTNSKLELWLVGRAAPEPELIAEVERRVDSNPAIYWEQEADDSRLRELYQCCDFTVYPSFEEGFGLPILESLWNARPCICHNSGAMVEVAVGGGCLMVDTTDADALASGIMQLVTDEGLRLKLAQEAVSRPFKKWRGYAEEIVKSLAEERAVPLKKSSVVPENESQFRAKMVNLEMRPLLSICITTYNRAGWLALSLKNLARLMPVPIPGVEIVVCDNTSTDHTPDVVKPYLHRTDFRYYRNPENVGMLGNLTVTAHHASGQYIWILGDDDLLKPGSIDRVLQIIQAHPGIALVYLNYSYTRQDDAKEVTKLDRFLNESIPIVPPNQDIVGPVHRICTESENFFTAIYCLVFRRDHALRAYSQNTEGRPFSTMLTCIPTTYYVLNFMMDEPASWVGDPQVVVNMNVSWMKYAPLWILERIPEVYDLAERMGANPLAVDHWRIHNLPSVLHFFKEIFENDQESNIVYFSAQRLVNRMKHLDEFRKIVPILRDVYHEAHNHGHPGAAVPPSQVFAAFQNQ